MTHIGSQQHAHPPRTPSRWIAGSIIATAMALIAAGCGSSDKSQTTTAAAQDRVKTQINDVIGRLQQASVGGDGKQICNDIFTPKLADSVGSSSKSGSCAKEVKANLFSPTTRITVQGVTVVDAANAVATIKEQNGNVSKVFMVLQSDLWRIRAVQPA